MKHRDDWLEQIQREPKGNAINSPDNVTNKGEEQQAILLFTPTPPPTPLPR
jgi:hypothetical protein